MGLFSSKFVRGRGMPPPAEIPTTESGQFDRASFENREPFRVNYVTICDGLINLLDFETVLDLGCGNGFLLQPMVERGKLVLGVEKSADAVALVSPDLRDRILVGGVEEFKSDSAYDLVACVEVAEHIDPALSERLVDVIVKHANRWIYFTAASPYQVGHGHINCRSQFFWMNLFRERGVHVDWVRTDRFLNSINGLHPAIWLTHNSLIFRKGT